MLVVISGSGGEMDESFEVLAWGLSILRVLVVLSLSGAEIGVSFGFLAWRVSM